MGFAEYYEAWDNFKNACFALSFKQDYDGLQLLTTPLIGLWLGPI